MDTGDVPWADMFHLRIPRSVVPMRALWATESTAWVDVSVRVISHRVATGALSWSIAGDRSVSGPTPFGGCAFEGNGTSITRDSKEKP